ncbi:hypothetical protein F4680DRAFT_428690 [Xylaria scruposa]|nr:hypothetical protein F4680DRAFT_428690 [Xylaria scruposa]
MESWAGYNYYTTNSTTWVELMNLSTAEFGLGSLPPGVRAVPGDLNNSNQFANDTYVIEHAGRGQFDEGTAANIVFGVVTAVAVLLAIIWLWFNFKTMLHPRNSNKQDLLPRTNSLTSLSGGTIGMTTIQDDQFCSARDFEDQIFNFYYEPINTEIEFAEKTANEVIDVEDIEAVTDLVRKMYSYDLLMYGIQSTQAYERQRHDLTSKRDGILIAVRDKVSNEWAKDLSARGRMGWGDEEWNKVSALKTFLQDQLPPQRFSNT